MKQKELEKYLQQETWYHGTTFGSWLEIEKEGIRADYNLGNKLDFGYGFYLAPKYKQAESYILRNIPYMSLSEKDMLNKPVVIEFELCLNNIIHEYSHKVFLHRDDEFAEFVIMNRMNPDLKNHNYDFVIGVMTDSNPIDLIMKYQLHEIELKEVKEGLLKWNSMEQLSLHNQSICDKIKVRKVTLVDEGKEFEINGIEFRKI